MFFCIKLLNFFFFKKDEKGKYNIIHIVPMLVSRFTFEIQNFISSSYQFVGSLYYWFEKIIKVRSMADIEQLNSEIKSNGDDIFYGIKKIIVAITKNHNVYAIDSLTSEILWV